MPFASGDSVSRTSLPAGQFWPVTIMSVPIVPCAPSTCRLGGAAGSFVGVGVATSGGTGVSVGVIVDVGSVTGLFVGTSVELSVGEASGSRVNGVVAEYR